MAITKTNRAQRINEDQRAGNQRGELKRKKRADEEDDAGLKQKSSHKAVKMV